MDGVLVAEQDAMRYGVGILTRVGFSTADATEIVGGFVEADLRGNASHGLLHLANLVKRARLGLLRADAAPRVLNESASAARIDADQAAGAVVGARAMDLAIDKAAQTGVGAVSVRNSTHFGTAGHHAERAARAGMIGIVVSNATPMMPAPGGAQAVLGTNPIAVAIPGEHGAVAISVDMGLTQTTMGAVRDLLQRGEKIPSGLGAGPDGKSTDDPAAALNGGFLLPAGGSKGFALGLAVDVLAGALSGGGVGPDVGSLFVDYDRPQQTSHFFLAIDPRKFLPEEDFHERLRFLASWIKGAKRADGAGAAYLPGERAFAEERERRTRGFTLDAKTAAGLVALGDELGVDVPESFASARA